MADQTGQLSQYINPTTISQQMNSLLSTATKTIETAGGVAADGLKKLSAELSKAGMPSFSALDSSMAQLSSVAPVTKFADNLVNKVKIPGKSPEESRQEPISLLQFPMDLPSNKFIKFTFASFYQPGPLFKRKTLDKSHIVLPIPGDLNERYGVQYQEKQLGVLGALQESGVLNAASNLSDINKKSAESIGKNLGQLATPGNAALVARNVIGAISDSAGAAIDRATGTILNPYTALQFTGVELRTHSFKYKFSPNSLPESVNLKNIIREFKLRMLPEKEGLGYNFPDVCTIEFSNGGSLYYFKNCYLKSMNVNYAPSGTPAFFIGGNFAAEVELSLEFGEIEAVTRNDVMKKDGNFTGDVGSAYTGIKTNQVEVPPAEINPRDRR